MVNTSNDEMLVDAFIELFTEQNVSSNIDVLFVIVPHHTLHVLTYTATNAKPLRRPAKP